MVLHVRKFCFGMRRCNVKFHQNPRFWSIEKSLKKRILYCGKFQNSVQRKKKSEKVKNESERERVRDRREGRLNPD